MARHKCGFCGSDDAGVWLNHSEPWHWAGYCSKECWFKDTISQEYDGWNPFTDFPTPTTYTSYGARPQTVESFDVQVHHFTTNAIKLWRMKYEEQIVEALRTLHRSLKVKEDGN